MTDRVPKPLVPLAGRVLLDHVLDRIATAGITEAVVNVHYKAELIEAHLAARVGRGAAPQIRISNERDRLLDTGGGAVKALTLLGSAPFLIHNSDTVWLEGKQSNLSRLIAAFDASRMDALLLLADRASSYGYSGRGDFGFSDDARLVRGRAGEAVPYVFAGASMTAPRLLRETIEEPFSLNRVWDRALAESRLFGLVLEGTWMHVGDPAALQDAERLIADASAS